MLCLRGWNVSNWQALPGHSLPALTEHLQRNLSYMFKHEGRKFLGFFFPCRAVIFTQRVKTGKQCRFYTAVVMPFTASVSLRASWYRRRRLNCSSDELPAFVCNEGNLWVTIHHRFFSLCWEDHCTHFSDISFMNPTLQVVFWFEFIYFGFLLKTRNYHTSVRFSIPTGSCGIVHHRMQMVILPQGFAPRK